MSAEQGLRSHRVATQSIGRSLSSLRPNGKQPGPPLLSNGDQPDLASAFSLLAQKLEHLAATRRTKAVLVMGAYPGDGRTTIVANLGIALAKNRHRVVLVDADLRHPLLAPALRSLLQEAPLNGGNGPVHNNGVSLEKMGIGGMPVYVLTPQTAEGVTSGSLMESLRASFDFILVDSAPYLGEADVFRLAALCDGAVYVMRSRAQDPELLRQVKEQLAWLGVDLLGAVYNDL
jgi:Mrp family chromosome partitioning ATPase